MPNGRYAYPEEVLADICFVAWRLGRTPKKNEYSRLGRFHAQTARKKFGSWYQACYEAGLAEPVTEEKIDNALHDARLKLQALPRGEA